MQTTEQQACGGLSGEERKRCDKAMAIGRSRGCCWRWSWGARPGEVTKGFVGQVEDFRHYPKGNGGEGIEGINQGNNQITGLESSLRLTVGRAGRTLCNTRGERGRKFQNVESLGVSGNSRKAETAVFPLEFGKGWEKEKVDVLKETQFVRSFFRSFAH